MTKGQRLEIAERRVAKAARLIDEACRALQTAACEMNELGLDEFARYSVTKTLELTLKARSAAERA